MKIDFTYNAQDDKTNEVQYFDTNGNMVAKYPYSKFEYFCDDKYPDAEISEVNKIIDEKWIELSTEFFHHMQPSDYPFSKQGLYNVTKAR